MKKKIFILISLVLLIAVPVMIFRATDIKNKFPRFDEVIEPRTVFEDITVEYLGKKIYKGSESRYDGFNIQVSLTNHADTPASYGYVYYLDYQYKGDWFMVYRPYEVPMCGLVLESGETDEIYCYIPENSLTVKGHYRLGVEGAKGVAYCYINIE